MTDYAIKLNSGTVVSRPRLNSLAAGELSAALQDLYQTPGAVVKIVDDFKKFFSVDSLLTAMDTSDLTDLNLIADHLKITIDQADLDAVRRAAEVKTKIQTAAAVAQEALRPAYPFWEVPVGWTVSDRLTITATHVYRKGSADRRLGVRTLQTLWERVSPYWAGNVGSVSIDNISRHYTYAYSNRVEVGCQTIQRYELEQLALHQGWEFPKVDIKG